jgi:hypothetical protein
MLGCYLPNCKNDFQAICSSPLEYVFMGKENQPQPSLVLPSSQLTISKPPPLQLTKKPLNFFI